MVRPSSWVSVARVLRPQGRNGEVLAEILTDFPERFASMKEAFFSNDDDAAPSRLEVERSWLHRGRVVLKFAGVDSISAAEVLRGITIVVPASNRVPLEAGAAYIDDLTGCELADGSQPGEPTVGRIDDVIRQEKAADLLVVRNAGGREYLIPFALDYDPRVDLEARRIVMNLPAGLLEIDAPPNEEELRLQQSPDKDS
jgi:16S rRNA processing protein RimM